VISDSGPYIAIAAGRQANLAVKADGTVVGWGARGVTPPAGLSNVIALAAGPNHYLALKRDGTVVGWGQNSYGEAKPPSDLKDAVAIAAAANHSLALKADGTVAGWGTIGWGAGQTATPPAGLTGLIAIAAGDRFPRWL